MTINDFVRKYKIVLDVNNEEIINCYNEQGHIFCRNCPIYSCIIEYYANTSNHMSCIEMFKKYRKRLVIEEILK